MPSMRQKPPTPERSTCWRRHFCSTIRVATLRLPAVYQWPEMAEQGGLIGYGPLIVQLYRDIMSRQLAKLLRGIKPTDLPVEQPTRFELVINLKTAKALGLTVLQSILARADEVIE